MFGCLLTCIVSDKNFALILIFVPFYLRVFLLWFYVFLFIVNFQQYDYDESWGDGSGGRSVCVHTQMGVCLSSWIVWSFLNLGILQFSLSLENIQPSCLQKKFSFLPFLYDTSSTMMLDHLILYHWWLRLILFCLFFIWFLVKKKFCFGLVGLEFTNLYFSSVSSAINPI